MKTSVIIVAAGSARRMGGIDKQYMDLEGMPVLARTVEAFEKSEKVDSICVVVKPGTEEKFRREILDRFGFEKVLSVAAGGEERVDSVKSGLREIPEDTDYIMIHDGARPYVSEQVIEDVLEAAVKTGGAVPAVPVKDTIKTVSEGVVTGTPERSKLMAAQTPQCFRRTVIMQAYGLEEAEQWRMPEAGKGVCMVPTDDASLVEMLGHQVAVSMGDYANIKITTPEDIPLNREMIPEYRMGTGFDAHRFQEGRALVLGGVHIPFDRGLLGHSDADVLLHAVMDAMLGASALGDIGKHFPDTDEAYRGADSLKLLEKTRELVGAQGWKISNIDATVMAQVPKLAPYIEEMRKKIAEAVGADVSRISVKATTTEGMGFTGREEGIAAQASAVLYR